MPTLPFDNHDDCGDYRVALGGAEIQVVNTATNLFTVWAGLALATRAHSDEARQNGVLLIAVGWFSAVYHATSSWGGFLLDIASMAIWATHFVGACQQACSALGGHYAFLAWHAQGGGGGRPAAGGRVGRLGTAVLLSACAVSGPFLAFEVFGASPVSVWNIWANSFLGLILLAVLPLTLALHAAGWLRRYAGRIALAVVSILMGVVFTQLIHALCVPGHLRAFPLHSLWHLCSALSGYIAVRTVDDCLLEASTPPCKEE